MTYHPQQFRSVAAVASTSQEGQGSAGGQLATDAELVFWRQGAVPTFDLVYSDAAEAHQVSERAKRTADPTESNTESAELVVASEGTKLNTAAPGDDGSRVPWEDKFRVDEANAKLKWVDKQIRAVHKRMRSLDPTHPVLAPKYGEVTRDFNRMDKALKDLHRAVHGEYGRPEQFDRIMISRFKEIREAIFALNTRLDKVDGTKKTKLEELEELKELMELKELENRRKKWESDRPMRRKKRDRPENQGREEWNGMTESERLKKLRDWGRLKRKKRDKPGKQKKQDEPAKQREKPKR